MRNTNPLPETQHGLHPPRFALSTETSLAMANALVADLEAQAARQTEFLAAKDREIDRLRARVAELEAGK